MRLVVLAQGKIKNKGLRSAIDDYKQRLTHYVRLDEIEVADAQSLVRQLPSEAHVVALEVDGEMLTSKGFAERLERWGSRGKGVVAFVIGGAEGIPKELSCSANVRLSLSSLTLPHRLARLVLLEQLYRAMTILRGEPYARE